MDTNLTRQLAFLVQQNTGVKLEKIIEQILESNVYNVNDLLENENVKSLNQPEGANKFYNTLFLFARENYLTYKQKKDFYIQLTPKMIQKLQILTIIDNVKENKNIGLDNLMRLLEINDPFELDSLIFEAISLGLISGKVDQKNKLFKVLSVKGRDYVPDLKTIDEKVEKWIDNITKSGEFIGQQVENLRNETNTFGENLTKNVVRINKTISDNESKRIMATEK